MSAEELQILERIAAAIEINNELLRGNLAAEMELERRREDARRRVQKHRAACNVTRCNVTQRNEEGEKRKIPHTPLKRKGEEEKKDTHTSRAREGIPSVEEVAEECAATDSDIDPQYFVNYYLSHPDAKLGDWKSMLANWTKNPIKSGRVEPEKTPRKKLSDKEWLKQIEEEVRKEREDGQKEC